MRSKYQDKNGLWHHKETRGGNPSSNNWMIYTAYAKALGLDTGNYQKYFEACTLELSRNRIVINRHPGLKTPPLSFDECIGAIYLGLIPYDVIKGNHMVYHGHGKRLQAKQFVDLLAGIQKYALALNLNRMGIGKKVKPRNIWWEKNIKEIKEFAVRLTPAHSYIVKRFFKKKFHVEEEKLWVFYRESVRKNRSKDKQTLSSKNLLWLLFLMNGDERRARKLKVWVSFERYFGKDHDFTKAVKKKYGVK